MIKFTKATGILASACLVLASLSSGIITSGAEEDNKVIIGYYDENPDFQYGASDEEKKSGYAYDYYQELARYTSWKYEYRYDTFENLTEMLEKGEIDMIAGISESFISGRDSSKYLLSPYSTGAEYGNIYDIPGAQNEEYFIAVSSKSSGVYSELASAQEKIMTQDPLLCSRLFEKYFKKLSVPADITDEGRKWLSSHQTIMVGYLDNYMPYSNKNKDKNNVDGAMVNIFNDMTQFLGKSISAVKFTTYAELYDALENGEIDAMFPACRDLWRLEHENTIATRPVVSDEMKVIYSSSLSEPAFHRIAVLSSSPVQAVYVNDLYPDAEVLHYNDIKGCISSLEKGHADSFIIEDNVLSYYLSDGKELKNLSTKELSSGIEYCFAAKKDSSVLCELLDTALASISDKRINETINQNLYIKNNFTFIEFFTHNILRVLVIAGSVAALAVLLYLRYKHIVKKQKKEIDKVTKEINETKQETTKYKHKTEYDHLTGVFSRGHFMELASSKIAHHRPNDCLRLVMMDIDNFKSVNDTYGHDNGDVVLEKLGSILKEISRVNGFAGRFGGEEFMLVLFGEDTNIQAHIINQVCKKLRDTEFSFTDRHITLSVGVTDVKDGDTLDKCIERADKALYYSKRHGKDQVNWYEEIFDKE